MDKLKGFINITKVPQTAYFNGQDGDIHLPIDIIARREPSRNGSTHFCKVYDREKQEDIIVGNFKPITYRKDAHNNTDDMPNFLTD